MRVPAPRAGFADFEMPEWMPGYYRLMHYAQYVSDFSASDGRGNALAWEQVTPHTWRVIALRQPSKRVTAGAFGGCRLAR